MPTHVTLADGTKYPAKDLYLLKIVVLKPMAAFWQMGSEVLFIAFE